MGNLLYQVETRQVRIRPVRQRTCCAGCAGCALTTNFWSELNELEMGEKEWSEGTNINLAIGNTSRY